MSPPAATSSSTKSSAPHHAFQEVHGIPALLKLRQTSIKRFGKALAADNSGTVAIENTAAIQLGVIDPVQKAAIDEITTLMQTSESIPVVSSTGKRMQAKAAEMADKAAAIKAAEAAQKKADESGGAGAAAGGAGGDGKKLTWAEARAAKQNQASAADAGAGRPGGRDTTSRSETDASGKKVIRTASGNTIDPLVVRVRNIADVTTPELTRMFGDENGLGQIARIFLLKEKGMAYITYKHEIDAKRAIEKMDKKKFKFLILAVDYGTVSTKRGPPRGGPSRGRGGGGGPRN